MDIVSSSPIFIRSLDQCRELLELSLPFTAMEDFVWA